MQSLSKLMVLISALISINLSAQSVQSERVFNLHAGVFNIGLIQDSLKTTTDIALTASNDTVWTAPFLSWPYQAIRLEVSTTGTVDISKVVYQQSPVETPVSNYIYTRDLAWKSTTSATETVSISSSGFFASRPDSEVLLPFRYARLGFVLGASNSATTVKALASGWINLER